MCACVHTRASRFSSKRFAFVQHPPGPMRRRWADYGVGLVASLDAAHWLRVFLHINARERSLAGSSRVI